MHGHAKRDGLAVSREIALLSACIPHMRALFARTSDLREKTHIGYTGARAVVRGDMVSLSAGDQVRVLDRITKGRPRGPQARICHYSTTGRVHAGSLAEICES